MLSRGAPAPLTHGISIVQAFHSAKAPRGRPAALHVTDDTARHLRYTSRAEREADVSLSHRRTMEHPVAPWSTTSDATGVTTPRQTVKASPHRHKWMLSRGAPAPLTHGIFDSSGVPHCENSQLRPTARRR